MLITKNGDFFWEHSIKDDILHGTVYLCSFGVFWAGAQCLPELTIVDTRNDVNYS